MIDVGGTRKRITRVREARGDLSGQYAHWFALVHDPEYLADPDPPIRLVTMVESMPLTRRLARPLTDGSVDLALYGRYMIVDVLDDAPPAEADDEADDSAAIRALEIAVAMVPRRRAHVARRGVLCDLRATGCADTVFP